jgi:DNA polymerase-3 subunit alpha
VGGLEKKFTKKDNRAWALFTISSRSVTLPVNMFSDAYEAFAGAKESETPLIMDGAHIIADARLVYREERSEWSINVHSIQPLRNAPSLIKKILFVLKPSPAVFRIYGKISSPYAPH